MIFEPTKNVYSLKKRLQEQSIRALALDFDDTVSLTNLALAELLLSKQDKQSDITAEELIAQYKYVRNIPQWNNPKITAYIDNIIQNNNMIDTLLAPDAKTAINGIEQYIPIAAYVTTRPARNTNSIIRWINDKGLPKRPVIGCPNELFLKGFNRDLWKAQTLEYLFPEIIGIIDDNEDLASYLTKEYTGVIFLHGTKITSHPKCVPCESWKETFTNVKEYVEEKKLSP